MNIKPFLSLKLTVSLLSKSAFIGKINKFYIIYGEEQHRRSFTSCYVFSQILPTIFRSEINLSPCMRHVLANVI